MEKSCDVSLMTIFGNVIMIHNWFF